MTGSETSWPSRDDDRLTEKFGADAALDLIPAVHTLEQEFYESDANLTAHDLVEMGEMASVRFRQRHPEVTDEAVDALAWCYTWTYK